MLGKWVSLLIAEGTGETHLPFSVAEGNWGHFCGNAQTEVNFQNPCRMTLE